MAGKPLEELRKYVESTGSPDYEKYLKLAALSLDRSSADDEKTELVEKQYDLIKIVPENDLQLKIRKSLLQEN